MGALDSGDLITLPVHDERRHTDDGESLPGVGLVQHAQQRLDAGRAHGVPFEPCPRSSKALVSGKVGGEEIRAGSAGPPGLLGPIAERFQHVDR